MRNTRCATLRVRQYSSQASSALRPAMRTLRSQAPTIPGSLRVDRLTTPVHSLLYIKDQAPLAEPGSGGDEGARTPDPDTARVVLSQLSYVPMRPHYNRPRREMQAPADLSSRTQKRNIAIGKAYNTQI